MMEDEIVADLRDLRKLRDELDVRDILNAKKLSKFDLDLLMNEGW